MPVVDNNSAVAERDLLTRHEVAEKLRVHITTVDRHVKDGSIPSLKLGHTVRIPADFIEQLLAEDNR